MVLHIGDCEEVPGRPGRRTGCGRSGRQIVYLRVPGKETVRIPGFVRLLQRRSAFPVTDGTFVSHEAGLSGEEAALAIWRELEGGTNAASLGLIAEPGPGAAAVVRILAEGRHGAALPGAVAIIGHDAQLMTACLDTAAADLSSRHIPVEWPAMTICLAADDPSLPVCARACRTLRAAGAPVRLEIAGPLSAAGADDAAVAELVGELDRFFDDHLAAHFPQMF